MGSVLSFSGNQRVNSREIAFQTSNKDDNCCDRDYNRENRIDNAHKLSFREEEVNEFYDHGHNIRMNCVNQERVGVVFLLRDAINNQIEGEPERNSRDDKRKCKFCVAVIKNTVVVEHKKYHGYEEDAQVQDSRCFACLSGKEMEIVLSDETAQHKENDGVGVVKQPFGQQNIEMQQQQ